MAKRYFWLKLKEDFFESKRIKKLRKLAGGDTYTIIYLKMQLKAMKTDGVLQFDGLENTFAEEIALDIDEEPENVQVTLSYLVSCGLVETSDDISFFFPFSVENTGSEGSSAKRMREYRERLDAAALPEASQCDKTVTERKSKRRDRDISKDREDKRHQYGEYSNVLLSDEDMDKLKAEFPEDWEARIERLSSYKASTGKVYKNDLATIRNWARKDGGKPVTNPKTPICAPAGSAWDYIK